MSKQGFIKLYRKVQDHWVFEGDHVKSNFEAWTDLLFMANHKTHTFMFGNESVTAERGQVITSEKKLMERWKWGKTRVRSFLARLEQDHMINRVADRKKTTLTICNYDVYHGSETTNEPPNKPPSKPQKKEEKPKKEIDPRYIKLAELLYKKMLENDDKAKKPNFEKWANSIRLLIEKDGREGKQVQEVIIWCQNDKFWKRNILSAPTLREKFPKLLLAMNNGGTTFKPKSKGGQIGEIIINDSE